MKFLAVSLVLVLMLAQGLALDCFHCIPKKAGGACEISTITCPAGKDACAAVKFSRPPYGHYQKCVSMLDCETLTLNAYMNVNCCQQDLCNTF